MKKKIHVEKLKENKRREKKIRMFHAALNLASLKIITQGEE